ncbi:MAG: hypothetical protein A3H91_09570 [Gammaproteobacteria bacterium RIFCSPLOWO2_02_FULL_61_13]|nr:MAG: hypothetical protein A3H91_09570 [Gammaproteobacteria bacterium RIFCSPLOWO2_02_FULL_61_13]
MSAILKDPLQLLIAAQQPGQSLAQSFYCDLAVYERDLEQVLSRQWLVVDHISRIPNRGDYFLFDIGNESIIVVREDETKIGAFFNVCRHRGSRVCLDAEGHKGAFTCPYHAWTYNLDGSLRSARLMPADFDKGVNGLHRCHVRVLEGFIFLCLAQGTPPDFDSAYQPFADWLGFHGFANARVAERRSYSTAANWKLVVENFIECYHCAPAHPEYCSVHPPELLLAYGAGPGSGPPEAEERFARELADWEVRARTLGHPAGFLFSDAADSPHLRTLVRLPIGGTHKTETHDGEPASKLMGQFKEFDGGETAFVFNAVSYLLAQNDFAILFRFTPRAPLLTDVEVRWIVAGDTEAGRDYDVGNLTWCWDVTLKQDKKITEDNQVGILSSRYQPGRYSEHERRVSTFVDWYLRQLA